MAEKDLGKVLIKGNQALVDTMVDFYQQYFPNCYYLELLRTGREDEETYLHQAVELATLHYIPVVATNEVVFLAPEDFDAMKYVSPYMTVTL